MRLSEYVWPVGSVVQADGVQIGTVAWFCADQPPTGYLVCDGTAISRTAYADLFSAIGTTFGVGDGSTTFNLPDLRGEFIRGWDDGRGVDSGRAFGSAQSWAIENIVGTQRFRNLCLSACDGAFSLSDGPAATRPTVGGSYNQNVLTFDASTVVQTDAETRPRNVALLPCIKYAKTGTKVFTTSAEPGDFAWKMTAVAPTGWLECDGSAISRSAYSDLFAVLGETFGVGDGSTTFNLPDLRGEFIRGYDNGRGVDSGRVFASAQADELKSHYHAMDRSLEGAAGTSRYETGSRGTNNNYNTGSTGGTETRPRNVALLPCVKY